MKNLVLCAAVCWMVTLGSVGSLWADDGQTWSFDAGLPPLPAGTGELILQTFEPSLSGQNRGPQVESELNPQIKTLSQQLEANVVDQLNNLNFVPFAKKMADASAMVARSMPIDYATKFKVFSLTGAAVVAGSSNLIDKASNISGEFNNIASGSVPNIGASADASLLLGINLAAFNLPRRDYFDPDRMQLFVSGMKLPVGDINSDQFSLDIWHVGLHGKYLLLGSRQLAKQFDFARWGGLAVATGLSYASQDVAIQSDLPSDSESSNYTLAANKTLSINYNYSGTGIVSTHSEIYSVPLEVSSSLQLLYFLTLYAGGGVDFMWGSTTMSASAKEPVNVTLSDGANNLSILSATPSINLNVVQQPTTVTGRAFFGLQINAGVAALFVQSSIDSTSTLSAAAGVRAFY